MHAACSGTIVFLSELIIPVHSEYGLRLENMLDSPTPVSKTIDLINQSS
jgi:hypothetical protein